MTSKVGFILGNMLERLARNKVDIVACDSLSQFRRELKTFLFRQSYPSILL